MKKVVLIVYFISLCICILLADLIEDSDTVEASGHSTTEEETPPTKPAPAEPTDAPSTPEVRKGVSLSNVFLGMFFGMILMFLLTQLYQWWYKRRVNNAEFRIY